MPQSTTPAVIVTANFARMSDGRGLAIADRNYAGAVAAPDEPCCRRGRRRRAANMWSGRAAAFRATPPPMGRNSPAGELSPPRSEHSTALTSPRPEDRHRPLERCPVSTRTARAGAPRWRQLLPGLPISEFYQDHRRRRAGDQGILLLTGPSAPGKPAARGGFSVFLALPAIWLEII